MFWLFFNCAVLRPFTVCHCHERDCYERDCPMRDCYERDCRERDWEVKGLFTLENAVFRPSYAGEVWKRNNHRSF